MEENIFYDVGQHNMLVDHQVPPVFALIADIAYTEISYLLCAQNIMFRGLQSKIEKSKPILFSIVNRTGIEEIQKASYPTVSIGTKPYAF